MAVRCCAQVRSEGTLMHYHQCRHLAVVERDGKDYCKTHDPLAVTARRAAREAKWNSEWEQKKAQWAAQKVANKRAELCVAACSTLTDVGVSELGRLLSSLPSLRKMLYHSVHDGSPEILLIENLITHKI